jgi:hypothetical protein
VLVEADRTAISVGERSAVVLTCAALDRAHDGRNSQFRRSRR